MMISLAAAAANFRHDVAFNLERIKVIISHAREGGASVLALPDGALGGCITDLSHGLNIKESSILPATLDPDGPEIRAVTDLAGDMVVCLGYCERGPDDAHGQARYNSAVCLSGDGVLGRYRKVHQLAPNFRSGQEVCAFDTPVGRMGMLIGYDKSFPETARSLAIDGAEIVACLSAWPTSLTSRSSVRAEDREGRLFDLYDQVRAAENQILWLSANQSGRNGALQFVGRAKVVGPEGNILARTWSKAGLAVTKVDPKSMIEASRATLNHLAERQPHAYQCASPAPAADE